MGSCTKSPYGPHAAHLGCEQNIASPNPELKFNVEKGRRLDSFSRNHRESESREPTLRRVSPTRRGRRAYPARPQGYPSKFDLGATASAQDIAAVAIVIAPDGKGLPASKGDYAVGKKVYETACGACHGANLQGVAGLPNMPAGAALRLFGGRGTLTTKNPVMTVESYWPYATTLFDYVRRAMPFQAPGSLTADEINAVSAYILAEGSVIDKAMV